MKKITLFLFFITLLNACKTRTLSPDNTKPEVHLASNAWQLDRYTDLNGKILANSSLNVSAIALYGFAFEFKSNNETRAFDKLTKFVYNRGTWALIDDSKVIDINITGFKGQFKIVTIGKGKLTLQASTGNFLSGVGSSINMEFTEFK